jgi:transcriptional regulator with XRE-family HTH domain
MKEKDKRLYDFAVIIRNQRIRLGFSSAEKFSVQNGINRSVYQRWENGEDLNISSLLRLCDILGLSASDLFRLWEQCNDKMPKTKMQKRIDELKAEIHEEDKAKGLRQ